MEKRLRAEPQGTLIKLREEEKERPVFTETNKGVSRKERGSVVSKSKCIKKNKEVARIQWNL